MGLKDDEIFDLTPAELHSLKEVWLDRQKRNDYLVCKIISMMLNSNPFGKEGKVYTPNEFMDKYDGEEKKQETVMSPEQFFEKIKGIHQHVTGEKYVEQRNSR